MADRRAPGRQDRTQRRAQTAQSDRLSAPSMRQLRVARERAMENDSRCYSQLRLSMPYRAGESLEERGRQIKEVMREEWIHAGSPLPRTPISPQLLSASGRWGVSSRASYVSFLLSFFCCPTSLDLTSAALVHSRALDKRQHRSLNST